MSNRQTPDFIGQLISADHCPHSLGSIGSAAPESIGGSEGLNMAVVEEVIEAICVQAVGG